MAPEKFDQKEKILLRVSEESVDGNTPSSESPVSETSSNSESIPASTPAASTSPSESQMSANSTTFSSTKSASVACFSSPSSKPLTPSLAQDALPDFGGRYETLELIGEGGMGLVYKVKDPALDKIFAIKVLRSFLVSDLQALKRFQKEAQAAINLDHPGLVAVYEHGTLVDGTPYIVMDFVDGVNLAQLIESEGRLDSARAALIFDQVMDALEHVHQSGLIHRDVKPRNIILAKSNDGVEQIKLVDFGIAKDAVPDAATTVGVTQTGDFLGSPLYMSPEQCQGAELESRSDIYSAGCVLYEMLSGKSPFASPNPVKIVVGHLSEKPSKLSTSAADENQLLKDLDFMALKCLEKRPENRYESATVVREELAACLDNRSPRRRQKASGKNVAIAISLAVVAIAVIANSVVQTGSPFAVAWYASEFVRPHAVALFGASLGLFLAASAFKPQAKSTNFKNFLMVLQMVSYAVMLPSLVLMPHVSTEPTYLVPYIGVLLCGLAASVLFWMKYNAIPKATFYPPTDAQISRGGPSEQVIQQLRVWRQAVVASFVAGALLIKAPLIFPVESSPVGTALLLLIVLFFVTVGFTKRRMNVDAQRKPGDAWLVLAGRAGIVAAFGGTMLNLTNYYTDTFVITQAQSAGMGSLAAATTIAGSVTALVFFAVWLDRKNKISPFGKTDGW